MPISSLPVHAHERDTQYGEYYKDSSLPFEVIPPGTDLGRFFPYYEYDMPSSDIDERFKQARVHMMKELGRFHFNPDKPLILALCRPDRRKNIGALIRAYGKSNQLKAIATWRFSPAFATTSKPCRTTNSRS